MKKYKLFVACDTTSLTKIKKILDQFGFEYSSKAKLIQSEYAGSNVQVRLRSDDGQEFNAICGEDHFFSHDWHEGDDIEISLDPAKIHPLSAKPTTAHNLQ